ncbi:unnamed protein product [Kluyveromyces dobzhanskii CBS 2104]|uniref:dolichyl-phosphate-mannose--protein mannosyltransferase n=1 Tax=Kluyveromyces dobzhanskii CBS 2104 TaxID=1427455 RepID=A0A0A8L2C2_9SACH|nr:unnamed protein product [Kluyveromyces dobzhanskii CBS 2104]
MNVRVSKEGRFKSYIAHDYQSYIKRDLLPYEKSLIWDLVLSALVVGYLSLTHLSRRNDISNSEIELWNQVTERIEGKFFISASVPTLIEVASKVSDFYSLGIDFWKTANNVVLATTLVNIYRILRHSNVSVLISFGAAAMFSQVSSFQDLIYRFNLESYHLLAISLVILHWRKFQASRDFSISWFVNITLLSMSLVFVTGGKFIGIVSYAWLLVVSLKSIWTIVGDIDVKNGQLFAHTCFRLLFFVIVPSASLVYSYFSLIERFEITSDSIVYMTSSFQHYTVGLHNDLPSSINYESVIRIRHVESLDGYLSSLDIAYPNSNDTMVTISDDPFDEASMWTVESRRKSNSDGNLSSLTVKQTEKVKLRNKKTGQLLRASEAKPPISDKEYDKRISTTGDSTYEGDQDELWKFEIQGKSSFRETVAPFKHYFMLKNPARHCSLLSHDIRMPRWADRRQEVLCVEPATVNRALFYIDFVSSPEGIAVDAYEWPAEYPFYKMLYEYVTSQFRLDKKQNLDNTSMSPPDPLTWPILFDDRNQIGKILRILSTVSVVVYVLIEGYSWLTWNLFEDNLSNITASKLMKKEVAFEAFLGWFLHLCVFSYSSHSNLSVNQYLPSLLFAVILLSQLSVV